MRMKGILIAMATTALMLFQSCENPGPVVLVGGGKIPQDAIVWLKQKSKTNNFVVITCNRDNGEFTEDDPNFINLITLRSNNRWVKMLENVQFVLPEDFSKTSLVGIGAIIIDGGDQWNYLTRLDGNAIQKAHEAGIPIMGTSAGAMILGEYYFSAENGTIGSDELDERPERLCLGHQFVSLPCLKGVLIDTHFSERQRNKRLQTFIEKVGASYGIGIDEETALCIDKKDCSIVGKGGIKLLKK